MLTSSIEFKLQIQIDIACVFLNVCIHDREQADAQKDHSKRDQYAFVKSRADRKAGTRRSPQAGGGSQSLDLLTAGDQNRACAEKADAVDDLCAETRKRRFLCRSLRKYPTTALSPW